jgi:hypothetical protein
MNPIIDIPMDAREDTEQLGSKPKFWVLLDDKRWLFKEARPNTGEDWSEKAAAEIARALGIRAATVELAQYGNKRGCISLNFVDVNAGEALVHGNEILALRVTGYDKEKIFRQSDHTLENIDIAIRGLFSTDRAQAILTELAGYMVFDALIGNTDRHHENWGLLARLQSDPRELKLSVAPSFDHASSLGRELRDERRHELLTTDRVRWYVGKGRGGIFRGPNERHGENPLRFVQVAARAYPVFFRPALDRVAALTTRDVRDIFEALPAARASEAAKSFAQAMIFSAQASLIEILK